MFFKSFKSITINYILTLDRPTSTEEKKKRKIEFYAKHILNTYLKFKQTGSICEHTER
jgi:hypothetical protein